MQFPDRFILDEENYKIIPYNWCPTQFYTITFDGWKCSLSADNPTFTIIMELAYQTLHSFINLYKDDYAFAQPMFCLKPDGTFFIKIATMENERYEYLNKKENVKPTKEVEEVLSK